MLIRRLWPLPGIRLIKALATTTPILPNSPLDHRRAVTGARPSPPISQTRRQASLNAQARSPSPSNSLIDLSRQLSARGNAILPFELAYESTPAPARRIDLNQPTQSTSAPPGVGLLVTGGVSDSAEDSKAASLTFRIGRKDDVERSAVVALNDPFLKGGSSVACSAEITAGGSAAVMTSGQLHPVVSILSAILPTPLILIATSVAASAQTLPVSPYPAPVGTRIRYPVWGANRMLDGDWTWVEAIVVGYRDYAGNIARTGTYDCLAHMLISPPLPLMPSLSVGSPLLDAETGAVVGILTGRKVAPTSGVGLSAEEHGWAVPAERLFEGFQLPGMAGKR